eukprot:4358946-Lingulodinium_polyedra.AAC.1
MGLRTNGLAGHAPLLGRLMPSGTRSAQAPTSSTRSKMAQTLLANRRGERSFLQRTCRPGR